MSCTPDAVVCDDTGPEPGLLDVLPEALLGGLLVVLVLVVLVRLVHRHQRRDPVPPVTRVWVNADGDVVRRLP